MFIAWTTVPTLAVAEELAADSVRAGLSVCVQIDGPIQSHYVWKGVAEKTTEYRLTFKLLAAQLQPLESWLHTKHPYETPEWIVIKAEHVGEKYLSWAQPTPNNLPF